MNKSTKSNSVNSLFKANKNDTSVKSENKLFFGAIILVCLLIAIAISLTYAYFARKLLINGENTETTVEAGLLDVDFLTSEYISNTDAKLINDVDAYKEADKTIFSVSRSEKNTVEYVYYTLQLVDINITENLKSPYLKWSLYETKEIDSSTASLSSGDFSDLTCVTNEDETETCKMELYDTKIPLAKNVTDEFVLIIWLSNDDNVNQNSLLKGSISGKVQVTAVNS